VHHNSMLIKIQPDATVCRYLFTAYCWIWLDFY